jgi:hypothetical protein
LHAHENTATERGSLRAAKAMLTNVAPDWINAHDAWTDSLGRWVDLATRVLGNAVNLVEASVEEMRGLLSREAPSVWANIASEGIVLAGSTLSDLLAAA